MTNQKPVRVALSGCGRIGRAFLKLALKQKELEVVAINDLADIYMIAYLLQYDTVYGKSPEKVQVIGGMLNIAGNSIRYVSEKEPAALPWRELEIDVAVEATGFFTSAEKARGHIDAGAKRVVITAPLKEEKAQSAETQNTPPKADPPPEENKTQTLQSTNIQSTKKAETVLMGINEKKLKTCVISSNASCTTNAAVPVIAILDEVIGIEKAILNTVHAYTATQSLVDAPAGKKGLREGRAAAVNIVPSSTGAAIAVTKAYPSLEGKFDGISLRVPVICGSITDITFIAKRDTNAEEVNLILRGAAATARWKGIFAVSDDELVSSDILGRSEGAIAELSMTRVVGGNLVKVLAWYDNEIGYASTLVTHVIKAGEQLK